MDRDAPTPLPVAALVVESAKDVDPDVDPDADPDPIYMVPYAYGVLHLRRSDIGTVLRISDPLFGVAIHSNTGQFLVPPLWQNEKEDNHCKLQDAIVSLAKDPSKFKLSDVGVDHYEKMKKYLTPWRFRGHVISYYVTRCNYVSHYVQPAERTEWWWCPRTTSARVVVNLRTGGPRTFTANPGESVEEIDASLNAWVREC